MKLFLTAVLSITLALLSELAPAQSPASSASYPTKPVRLLVGFSAGGPPDILARMLAQNIAEGLGQQVVVENRPGAGGTIAGELAANAQPDGYTLLLGNTSTLSIAPSLYPKLGYDANRSFAPVGAIATAPYFILVHPGLSVSSVRELVELARVKPGELNFGSPGNGTPLHIAGEMFKTATGASMVHVPYKDIGLAHNDFLSGRFQVMFQQLAPVERHIQAGKLRPIAVAAASRAPQLPNVPTAAEAGLPDFELLGWYGLLAPRGTPAEAIRRLNAELRKVLDKKEVRDRLAALAFDPSPGTPEQFQAFVTQQNAYWSRAVKASGAKLD
jgi:tripartite-type tricarboxylate transporter receptor subunit TctC